MASEAGAARRVGDDGARLHEVLYIPVALGFPVDRLRGRGDKESHAGAMALPGKMRAAISRSSSFPLAQDPMNAWSIFWPLEFRHRKPVCG